MKVDQPDLLSKFHLAVALTHYANSAEGMVLIARATQKSNKLLLNKKTGQEGVGLSWLKYSSQLIPQFSGGGRRICLALRISHLLKQTRNHLH